MPRASFDEGLDVIAPERVRARDVPQLLRLLVKGGDAAGVIAAHDLDRLVVRCDRPVPLQADGEDLGDVDSVVSRPSATPSACSFSSTVAGATTAYSYAPPAVLAGIAAAGAARDG